MAGMKNGRKPGKIGNAWTEKEQSAFISLLEAFGNAPLLRHFDPNRPGRIETDASKLAMGGVFSQKHDDGWHPVAFFSRQFKGPETCYSTPDQEMLAIVQCFKTWRHYVEGSKFPIEVITDHKNLQGFMKQPRLNGRQARWCFFLTPFDFTIKYRAGVLNPADAPSRRPDYRLGPVDKDDSAQLLATLDAKVARQGVIQSSENIPGNGFCQQDKKGLTAPGSEPAGAGAFIEELAASGSKPAGAGASEDAETDYLLHVVRTQFVTRKSARDAVAIDAIKTSAAQNNGTSEVPEIPVAPGKSLTDLICMAQSADPFCQKMLKAFEGGESGPEPYSVEKGLLMKDKRLWVPQQRSLIMELIQTYHDSPVAGHWGITKTLELLQRHFRWFKMKEDVKEYVMTCPVCQGLTVPNHKPYGVLQPLPIPDRPFREISMDWITGLPHSRRDTVEYNSILTIVDRLTKIAIFVPVQDTMRAPELAELLYYEVECRYGPPSAITSDRDSRITSAYWAELCKYALIKRRISTAFHPQTDGQTEILN